MSDLSNWRNQMISFTELYFSIIFLLEFLVKIISMGFVFGEGTYLKNGWNLIDFTVVISSLLNFLPSTINFTAIRTLRVLKPLKNINSIPRRY